VSIEEVENDSVSSVSGKGISRSFLFFFSTRPSTLSRTPGNQFNHAYSQMICHVRSPNAGNESCNSILAATRICLYSPRFHAIEPWQLKPFHDLQVISSEQMRRPPWNTDRSLSDGVIKDAKLLVARSSAIPLVRDPSKKNHLSLPSRFSSHVSNI